MTEEELNLIKDYLYSETGVLEHLSIVMKVQFEHRDQFEIMFDANFREITIMDKATKKSLVYDLRKLLGLLKKHHSQRVFN